MSTTFSEHARERLLDLYNKHDHEVGRVLKEEHPELYKALTPTDCITYALNVITYAYTKTNNAEAARQVKKLGAHGHRVSEYLVSKQRWVGVYISPDVTHPVDGSREHTFANQLVNKTCTYYQVPIKYRAVNYNPTPKDDPNFQKLNKKAAETVLNQVDLAALAKVPFGFGISRGGMHTWLFSFGSVYEVHWDGIGSGLYERTALEVFGWLSGAIVVRPGQPTELVFSNVPSLMVRTMTAGASVHHLRMLFLFLGLGLATSCASRTEGATTVVPYGSFGPQAMAYEVLGFEWWQWQPHGDSRPREYDVRVVVYCNSSEEEVARQYPVDRKAKQDYRYITYERALGFLDKNIQEDIDPALTDELRATRKELVERLPSCSK